VSGVGQGSECETMRSVHAAASSASSNVSPCPLHSIQLEDPPLEGTPLEGTPLEGTPLEGTPLEGTPLEGMLEDPPLDGTSMLLVDGVLAQPGPPPVAMARARRRRRVEVTPRVVRRWERQTARGRGISRCEAARRVAPGGG
jgi:hypothetical protein